MTAVQDGREELKSLQQMEEALNFQKEHDKIVAWTKHQFRAIREARAQQERQWYYNLAFFFGRQYVQYLRPSSVNTTARLYTPPAPYYRARPVINRIRSTIRTELSQLVNNKPNASVVPASAEDRDLYAAMAGEQIWENFYQDKKLKAVIRRAMWWTLTCGTGYIKCYWDFHKEDVYFCHETPFHVLVPDLRQEELEEQPFIIHAQTRSAEYVKMYFKDTPINQGEADAMDLLNESYLNLVGTQNVTKQHNVLILEVWVKPGQIPLFPDGAYFTVIGDTIVQSISGWPYRHGKFPFAKFDHIPSGKYYGTSLIEDLIPLQKEYNRTRGQIIEAKNRMSKPQLVAPRGSVNASAITTEPGQVIEYTPGFNPPQPLPLTPLPSYVVQEIDRILTDWNDLAGQHEVTHGQVPPGVTAATAISYLQERDESKLTPTFDSLEEGIEKIAQLSLEYVNEFWDMPRIVRITGTDGSFDAQAFKGSDLDHNLDIRIEAGSALPVSKAAKQALLMDLMKMGFVDPNEGLQLMDMGTLNKLYDQLQIDQRQAQRENLRMAKVDEQMLETYNMQNAQMMEQSMAMGQEPPFGVDEFTGQPLMPPLIVPVNTWDNHQAHIEYHNRFRKGQSFEMLPEAQKQLFEAHVNAHIEALGLETVTQDPREAAGLPPLPPVESEEGEESAPPGPEPMPEPMEEGF